jgi:hypothetical protein
LCFWFIWFGPVNENGCLGVNNFASWESKKSGEARKSLETLNLEGSGR